MARASRDAAKAIRFLKTLQIAEGRSAGRRLRLAKYQPDFIKGAYSKGTSIARLSIGRGNGKTAISAGLSLAHLMSEVAPQPKREILFASRNRDQSKIVFGFLVGFIENHPEHLRGSFTIRRGQRLEVECSLAGGDLARAIAAGSKSILGGAPTLSVLDVRAAWHGERGDAQLDRTVGRVEAEVNYLGHLAIECRGVRDLEAFDRVRPQPCIRPDPPYARWRDEYRFGHGRAAPVRGDGRQALHGLRVYMQTDLPRQWRHERAVSCCA